MNEENKTELLQKEYVASGGSTGYVQPTSISTENVDISESHSRERESIVRASVQVNESVKEDQVNEVNNQIKVKKKSPILTIIILIILIACIVLIIKFIPPIVNNYVDSKTTTTTTTTTTRSLHLDFIDYLSNKKIVRKFSNNDEVLLLLPFGIDIFEKKDIYLYIDKDGNKEYGNYVLGTDKIELNNQNGSREYHIEDTSIKTIYGSLTKDDSEYKSYSYKDDRSSKYVVLNADDNYSISLYVSSDLEKTEYTIGNYLEDDVNITIENSIVFNKIDINTIEKDGNQLTLN